MKTVKKPWWQQATALVSVTAGGAVAGFNFAPGTPADLSAPAALPVHLAALEKSAQVGNTSDDAVLRQAIVNVAMHYLRIAQVKTPAEVEALIWGKDSIDGADHGASCAAFASLTLELAAQATGHQSWVTGGSTYPWPLHEWADVRVDPNPSSLGIVSVLQDAQTHDRWHPVGDGYTPLPGDWVLFDGHVEVVTSYADGVLHTIGGDSLPNYSVNAHTYTGSLTAAGVAGFVDNGNLASSGGSASPASQAPKSSGTASHRDTGATSAAIPGAPTGTATAATGTGTAGTGTVGGDTGGGTSAAAAGGVGPASGTSASAAASGGTSGTATGGTSGTATGGTGGTATGGTGGTATGGTGGTATGGTGAAASGGTGTTSVAATPDTGQATVPGAGTISAGTRTAGTGTGTGKATTTPSAAKSTYARNKPATSTGTTTSARAAFINEVAPGAIETQRQYGIPAAVTIAQAIDESGWGKSELAVQAHNLFGIKGTGPAGSITMSTEEYENGAWVTTDAQFAAYHDFAESIAAHGSLLATDGAYSHAMADKKLPDAFAADLAGVYATDPSYGGQLVSLMKLYDLYRFDVTTQAPAATQAQAPATQAPATQAQVPAATQAPAAHKRAPASANASIPGASSPGATTTAIRYKSRIPLAVADAYVSSAKGPLTIAEPLYRDIAALTGIPWALLAACDWLQCGARAGYSPVQGEKLGKVNPDGTVYRTKSEALAQCAADLAGLAVAVYGIDLTRRAPLSVRDLAKAFAAFRWGELLRRNRISALEFPYSVAGLTAQHTKMCWPKIAEPYAPDKPGSKFRGSFGAVPIVLSLDYPATV